MSKFKVGDRVCPSEFGVRNTPFVPSCETQGEVTEVSRVSQNFNNYFYLINWDTPTLTGFKTSWLLPEHIELVQTEEQKLFNLKLEFAKQYNMLNEIAYDCFQENPDLLSQVFIELLTDKSPAALKYYDEFFERCKDDWEEFLNEKGAEL